MTIVRLLGLWAFLNASLSHAEIFQLQTVERVESASKLEEETSTQLVEKEKIKRFVIDFLKANPDAQYRLTSEKYKKAHQSSESLKRVFSKESYGKLDFQQVQLFQKKTSQHATVKANLEWFAEGYDGVQTFYFMLIKEQDRWVLDWMVY